MAFRRHVARRGRAGHEACLDNLVDRLHCPLPPRTSRKAEVDEADRARCHRVDGLTARDNAHVDGDLGVEVAQRVQGQHLVR